MANNVTALDMILLHMYPRNPIFIALIFEGVFKCGTIILDKVCRLLLNYINAIAVFILMCVFLACALAIGFFLQPSQLSYQWLGESKAKQHVNDNEPLLKSDD